MIAFSYAIDKPHSSTAKGGYPSPAQDYIEERIDLNRELIEHPLATFFVQYAGTAMQSAFIPQHARLLVDKSLEPQNGNIVVAMLDGKFTVRFLKKNPVKAWLVAGDRRIPDIEISNRADVVIWGVVKNVIIDTKLLTRCMH